MILKSIPPFKGNHPLLVLENLVVFFVILIKFFTLTFELFISGLLLNKNINLIITVVLVVDSLVQFNTPYTTKGIFVFCRKRIALNYLRKHFFLDLLALIPLVYIELASEVSFNTHSLLYDNPAESFIFFLFLFKVFRLYEIIEKLEEIAVEVSTHFEEVYSMIVLVVKGLMILHLLACTWSLMAETGQANNELTWLDNKTIDSSDWSMRYIYSFYFVTTTLVSVGYGDITPRTSKETMLGIVTMLLSCSFLGYFIGNINQLLNQLNSKHKKRR